MMKRERILTGGFENQLLKLLSDIEVRLVKTISDTIEKWNIDTFVEDIESQIGKDLQFIRINGTLIGGLIGVVIYLLTGFTH